MSINPAPRRPPQWPDHPPARGTSNRPVRMRLGQSTESVTDDRSANYSSDLCFEKPHTQWAFLSFYPQYSWTRPIPRHSALRWSRTSTPTRSGIAEKGFLGRRYRGAHDDVACSSCSVPACGARPGASSAWAASDRLRSGRPHWWPHHHLLRHRNQGRGPRRTLP